MPKDIKKALSDRVLILDGAMGSLLIERGVKGGESSSRLCIESPETVKNVHLEYIKSGADIISSATFGANPLKEDNYSECIERALDIALEASECEKSREVYVAFDIGPSGKLLEPFGDMSFEAAVAQYKEIIMCGRDRADLILFETFTDCLEAKAAVIAAKECSKLPIFLSFSFDENSRTMTGSTPESLAVTFEGLSVSAIGVNCSVGPKQLRGTLERLCRATSVPVFAMPNAGLPVEDNGAFKYDLDDSEFAEQVSSYLELGVFALGGCCGSTPLHIEKLKNAVGCAKVRARQLRKACRISSRSRVCEIGNMPLIIGERINPTGKKKLKEALNNKDHDYILGEALSQERAGADILDVNCGLPTVDEKAVMPEILTKIQAICPLPLQIDTVDPEALEKGLRVYAGKALINSVNGKQESMDAVLPLAKKYGGAVIALTLDEKGIPSSAKGRLEIAQRIIAEAEKYGICKRDIIIDPLALAVSSDPESARVTLESIELIKKHTGAYVSLGVSNISFGLPNRDFISSTFFTMALEKGLDLAIINPCSLEMMKSYRAFNALNGRDTSCADYIAFASAVTGEGQKLSTEKGADKAQSATLVDFIVSGIEESSVQAAKALLEKGESPLDIINGYIIPALEKTGRDFESGRAFLPQLLMSADSAKAAFSVLKEELARSQGESKGKIVLATVKGDLHDIGKNIVKTVLESYGFEVIDLGRDVDPSEVLKAVKEGGIKLVGLSALMTTTVPAMKETVTLLKSEVAGICVMVGGAVLSEECARLVGADHYAEDAIASVRIAEKVLG